jgi:hypothetical protein
LQPLGFLLKSFALDYLVVHEKVDDSPHDVALIEIHNNEENPNVHWVFYVKLHISVVVARHKEVGLHNYSQGECHCANNVSQTDEKLVASQDHDEIASKSDDVSQQGHDY